jgi:hypothetical protein
MLGMADNNATANVMYRTFLMGWVDFIFASNDCVLRMMSEQESSSFIAPYHTLRQQEEKTVMSPSPASTVCGTSVASMPGSLFVGEQCVGARA